MSQTFFLTGCASGMARRLTDTFQKRGDQVYATDLNIEALQATAKELGWPEDRVKLAALNVCDYQQFEAAFNDAVQQFGKVDVLMNIAGLLLASWVNESSLKEIDAQIDVNIKGVIYGTRIASNHMIENGNGHIINIASIAGIVPAPGLSTYCATKYAVRAYSVAAAYELKPKGVMVTAICPSSVETPMLDAQLDNDAAAMFYSGFNTLTLDDIERTIMKALKKRPYTLMIPFFKSIFLARPVDIFPSIGPWFTPLYMKSGKKRLEERRKAKEEGRKAKF